MEQDNMSNKNFSEVLNEQLESFSDQDVSGKYDLIIQLQKELQDAQDVVADAQMKFRHAVEDYNVELARSLRKKLPQLAVNLSDGRCSAGYKSTNLSCKPDFANHMWVFDGSPHGRRFVRQNGHALNLSNQFGPLVDAMVKYFSRYKSLR